MADKPEPRLCWACGGEGIQRGPDPEDDGITCPPCDGSGLAAPRPSYVEEPWRSQLPEATS